MKKFLIVFFALSFIANSGAAQLSLIFENRAGAPMKVQVKYKIFKEYYRKGCPEQTLLIPRGSTIELKGNIFCIPDTFTYRIGNQKKRHIFKPQYEQEDERLQRGIIVEARFIVKKMPDGSFEAEYATWDMEGLRRRKLIESGRALRRQIHG